MKENPADPRTVLNNDCLAPEGYGEIIGGSQREDDYDKLLAPHPGAGTRSRSLPLVSRPAAVRHLRALRLRARRRADGRLDLRAGPYPGGHRLSPSDPSVVSVGPTRRLSLRPTAWSNRSSPAPARSIPRASASVSTRSNRSRNFRLARSSAMPGSMPALRARFTTVKSRSPISSISRSLGAARGVLGSTGSPSAASDRTERELLLHFRQLLPHLGQWPLYVGPVESHARSALLQAVGPQQRRQRRHQAGQRPAPPLTPLDALPRLGRAQVEEVGMAPPHLGLELIGDPDRR